MPDSGSPLVDYLLQLALSANAAFFDELRGDLVRRLAAKRKAGAGANELLQEAQSILFDFTDPLVQLLTDADLAAWLHGAAAVARLTPSAPQSLKRVLPVPPAAPLPLPWEGYQTWRPVVDEAVEDLLSRHLLSRSDYDALGQEARQRAFTVAGVSTDNALQGIRQAVVDAISKGDSLSTFRKKVKANLSESQLAPSSLEMIYRTNVQQAYSNGQDKTVNHPLVRDVLPYEAQVTIPDGRRTPLCALVAKSGLDGTNIYRRDDPFILRFKSPRHWQCRCARVFKTVEQVARAGVQEAIRWLESGVPPMVPTWVDEPPGIDELIPKGWESGVVA